MTIKKNSLLIVATMLAAGLFVDLVFSFSTVKAFNNDPVASGKVLDSSPNAVAAPEAEINPTCVPNTTGAISYWSLNETTGTTFTDTVGSHNGSCSGDSCPSPITGTNAGGQFFIDTDPDAITVPTNVAFDFLAADPFSAGIWVKTTQSCTDNKVYIGRHGTAYAEGQWWLGCTSSGTPGEGVARFHMRDSDYINSRSAVGSTPINDGKWHYLTGVWDGTDTKLYVDGTLEDSVSSPLFTGNFNSAKPLTIGAYDLPIGYFSIATLDEAAVYDAALTELFIDNYIATCDSFPLSVGDVTFDTSKNATIPITAAELLANSTGTLSAVDVASEKGGATTGTAPAGPFTYTPFLDYVGKDFFTFLVSNGLDTASGTAVITQEAPQVTTPGAQTNWEGAAVSLQIVAVDPQGDVMTYAATGLPTGLNIASDTGLISGKVAAGAAGSYDPVTVTVTDVNAYATAVEFVWTIDANEIPVINPPIGPQSNAVGEAVSLQVVASDGDADTLTYGALNLPAGLTINTASGLISGTVGPGAVSGSATVSVSDSKAAPLVEIVIWTITGANMPPVVVKPADQANFEGDIVSLQVVASDPDSDPLTYSATGLPAGLSINPTSGLISGTITAGANAFSPYTVKVKATDPGLLSDEREFIWTIAEANQPPVVVKPADQANIEGDVVSLQVVASDPDSDPLTYSATGLPSGLSINPTTGLISGKITVGASTFSPYTAKVKATDPGLLSDEREFTWTVAHDNAPPDVTNPGDQANIEGDIVSLQVLASDPDSDPLTYSATGLPAGLSINPTTGLISGVIDSNASDISPYNVTVSVDDGFADLVQVMFNWTIESPLYYIHLPLIFGKPCTDFFDDFSDPNSGWAVGEDEDYRYEYLGGEYRVLSKNDLYGYMFGAPTCARENYTVDVDARWVGPPGESYGILFGIIGNYDQFYIFDVNTDYQDYRLLRFDGNDYHNIVPQSHSTSINSGTASNQLKITRNGYQITLEVNGSVLGSWTDSNIDGETYTGIISTPYLDYPISDARFDNFSVTQVSSLEQSSMIQSNSMAPFISPRKFMLAPSRKEYLIDPDLMIH